jgi:hypothetical protein
MNIYVYNDDLIIPNDETCYIVAKGGIYLKKKLDLIESLTPVDKISFLKDIPPFAKLHIPKITSEMFGNILTFFREVYKLHRSEAVVLIFFNKKKKIYKVYVPEQEVSYASVNYVATKTIKDFQLIGSIHSHSSMSAFHSGTDVGDEKNFDGLHMTIGKVDDVTFFDICASIAVNGMRVPVQPEEYIDGLEYREFTNYFPSMFRPNFEMFGEEKIYKNTVKTSIGYVLNNLSNSFNQDWLKKIKEKTYTYTYDNLYGFSGGGGGAGRYIFKDGKLVKIDDEKSKRKVFEQLSFGFEDKFKKKDYHPCKTCIYKCQKLELQKEGEKEEILRYNKIEEFDYSSNSNLIDYDPIWNESID